MRCSTCGSTLTNDVIRCECGTYKRKSHRDIIDHKQLTPLQLLIMREMLAMEINEASRLTPTG